MFLTIFVFILILGLLIFVHELGHFMMAKRAGIKVEEFGFGFPPRLFGIKRGETVYSLNLFPIGGFVKIYGENNRKDGEKDKEKKRAFYSQPIKIRTKILVAGVAMNLILAIILLGFGHLIGLPTIIGDDEKENLRDSRIQVAQVAFDSPAEKAGIMVGDTIRNVLTITELQQFIRAHQGEEIVLTIERGNDVFERNLVPRLEYPQDQGPLGIALVRTAVVSQPWYKAFFMGVISAFTLLGAILAALGNLIWQLITTGQSMIEGGGPVYIFSLTGQAAQLGFIYILQLTAILSINLAIINILPFPALDGGRLIFLAIEKIKGSPVSQKIEGLSHTLGFIVLIFLMIAITWHDIVRLF